MPEERPRIARLTAIITQLQSKSIVTARDMAEKHGVSIRTIYRDVKTLEKSGIPIIMQEGKGYSMMEGYKLPPIMFTEEEANALITAEQIINKNRDRSLTDQYQNAITKVKSVLRSNQKEKTELLGERIQIRTKGNDNEASDYLITLQSAIINYQIVFIHYLSLENRDSKRKIEPFALFSTNENWILVAFCQYRNAFRAFRLDRIRELRLTGERFEPHDISLQEYFDQCRDNSESTPDIHMT